MDTWDPKPEVRPRSGDRFLPYQRLCPAFRLCEHLPLQASMASKLSFLRAVDCSMRTTRRSRCRRVTPFARRTDNGRDGDGYPSMGRWLEVSWSQRSGLPAFVGLAPSWVADVWEAGHMGGAYAPVNGDQLAGRCAMRKAPADPHVRSRSAAGQFDGLRKELDRSENWIDSPARSGKRSSWCRPGKCRRRST